MVSSSINKVFRSKNVFLRLTMEGRRMHDGRRREEEEAWWTDGGGKGATKGGGGMTNK